MFRPKPYDERRGGGLVDDADDVEPGDLAGVLGRLALVVVEVRRHRDDGLGHRLAQVVLGDDLHLLEHHRADLRHGVLLVAEHDADVVVRALDDAVARRRHGVLHLRRVPLSADEPLRGVDGVLGVRDRLPLRDVADEPLARLGHGDHRRSRLVPAAVGNDARRPVLHDGDARIRRAEVDSDHLLQGRLPSYVVAYGRPPRRVVLRRRVIDSKWCPAFWKNEAWSAYRRFSHPASFCRRFTSASTAGWLGSMRTACSSSFFAAMLRPAAMYTFTSVSR